MIERGSCVPSSMPRRCDSEPAATLRTTTSSGMISTSRISCSRMLSRRMKVRRHADVVEVLEDVFGDAVVEDALAFDHLVLLGVEGGRVVLEVLDQRSRLRPFVEDLGLAFVDAATAAHRGVPWFVKVHLGAVAPCGFDCPRRRTRGKYSNLADAPTVAQTSRSRWRAQSTRHGARSCAQRARIAMPRCCLDHHTPLCKAAQTRRFAHARTCTPT